MNFLDNRADFSPSNQQAAPQASDEVGGVWEGQVGIFDINTTPVIGTTGMSTCSAMILIDPTQNRGLIAHITEHSPMDALDPMLADFLEIPGRQNISEDDLRNAIQGELNRRNVDSISLVTVAGNRAQNNYFEGPSSTNSMLKMQQYLGDRCPGGAINHSAHSMGESCLYDTRNQDVHTNIPRHYGRQLTPSNEIDRVLVDKVESFDASSYNWGPVVQLPGETVITQKNQNVVGDDQGEALALVVDQIHPNEFQASIENRARQVLVDSAIEKMDYPMSSGRREEVKRLVSEAVASGPEIRGANLVTDLANGKVSGEYADLLAGQLSASMTGNEKTGQRPGTIRQALDSNHVKGVGAANNKLEQCVHNSIEQIKKGTVGAQLPQIAPPPSGGPQVRVAS